MTPYMLVVKFHVFSSSQLLLLRRNLRSIRTCYARELLRRKKEESVSGASRRHFETLDIRSPGQWTQAEYIYYGFRNQVLINYKDIVKELGQEVHRDDDEVEKRSRRLSRKRANNEYDELPPFFINSKYLVKNCEREQR